MIGAKAPLELNLLILRLSECKIEQIYREVYIRMRVSAVLQFSNWRSRWEVTMPG